MQKRRQDVKRDARKQASPRWLASVQSRDGAGASGGRVTVSTGYIPGGIYRCIWCCCSCYGWRRSSDAVGSPVPPWPTRSPSVQFPARSSTPLPSIGSRALEDIQRRACWKTRACVRVCAYARGKHNPAVNPSQIRQYWVPLHTCILRYIHTEQRETRKDAVHTRGKPSLPP